MKPQLKARFACYLFSTVFLTACGGGGGGSSGGSTTPVANAIPSLTSPVTDGQTKANLKNETWTLDSLLVTEISAHRTAESSFGALAKSAPRLSNHTVQINGNWSGMLATGMYAAPGEIVDITVPPELLGKSYVIRLSGHSDDISENQEWQRMPRGIQRNFLIKQTTTRVASPYGGAIYIDLLEGADASKRRSYGNLNIVINNAVEAPYFILGKTSNAEWVNRIRQNPAPYAELVSERLALSVPSSMIRQLANPEELLQYWNEVVALHDWVGGTENYRSGPDRINLDVQISNGYLHAGYPIQAPATIPPSRDLLNLEYLRKEGEWGFFHELGHEMQKQQHLWGGYEDNAFTFNDGVEVSVNIFAKAAMDKFAPFATATQGSGWGWSVYPGQVLARAVGTIKDSNKPNFSSKDQYPFYYSLADGFGWSVYRQVLSSYTNDAVNKSPNFPRTNQQKKDQWLIRWSKFSGYNMVEYMARRWKLEVSEQAIQTVNAMNLPNWLPATTSVNSFTLPVNGSKQLDLKNTGFGLDGPVPLVRVVESENIRVSANPDGSHTVSAKAGFVGRDKFTVVYRSEAGNEVSTTINVGVGAH